MMLHTESDTSSSARHLNLLFNNSTILTSSLLLQPGLSGSLMKAVCERERGREGCLAQYVSYNKAHCNMFSLRYECWRHLRVTPDKRRRCWQNHRDLKSERQFHRKIKSEIFFKNPKGAFCRTLQGLLSALWGERQNATLCAQQPPAH